MSDVTIPVFDGENYGSWKKRIIMYLKMKKCDAVATREKTTADKQEEWDENNLKAINYIYSAITNKQLEFVSEKNTAYEIVKKFDELYSKESTALQIICRNKLDKLRLKNYNDTAVFFSDFEKAVNELKTAGAQVTEKEKMNYMLRTLPESLSYIGDLVDVLKEEDQTVEYVKNKIRMIDLKNKDGSENSGVQSNAFLAENKTRTRKQDQSCYNCGKTGHFKRDCRQDVTGRGSWKRGVQYQGRNRGNFNQRGGYGNWQRGRGEQHGSKGGRFQGTRDYQQSGHSISNFITEVQSLTVRSEIKSGNNNEKEINWLLDSGCTDHIINNDEYFSDYVILENPINVKIADGKVLKATKVGHVISKFSVYGGKIPIKMQNVYYVENMERNLISYARITDKHKIVSIGNNSKVFDRYNNLIAIAWKEGRVYKMTSVIDHKEVDVNVVSNSRDSMTTKEKWHRILGHVNFNYLKTLCKDQLLDGVPEELESEFMKCKICIENKMHNVPFENNRSKAKEILEIIHTDLNGPQSTPGLNGEKYFLTFIDDYSKVGRVYPIKSKDQVYDCFVRYVNEIENLTGKTIKKLRCDNGKEYMNKNIYQLVKKKGIVLDACPPYVHELNGTAERYNRSIMDMSRCLLAEARVDRKFWPEVVCAAAYLKNRTLANTIEKKTPYEILFRKKPNAKHLRLYGSRVFVRVPEQLRRSKWDRKADLGILLGYNEVGYRVLVNNRVIIARHVDLVEENVKCIALNRNDSESECSKDSEYESIESKSESKNEQKERNIDKGISSKQEREQTQELRRSKRERKFPSKYEDSYVYSNEIYVNFCSADSPVNFEEAINSDESESWKHAMNKEIECLNKNKTWNLVEKPEKKVALDVKWVYTKKSENNYKARLVVRGFQQKEIVDDIYSPVAKMQTFKILLSYCCQEGLIVEQMDVETAFLNSKVLSEIYVKQPRGYEDGTDKVCKLEKALYGLRESPRAWYDCFDNFLEKLGFKRSEYDYCLYTMRNGNDAIYLIMFVDDLLICCKNKKKKTRYKL